MCNFSSFTSTSSPITLLTYCILITCHRLMAQKLSGSYLILGMPI